ncbi:hypothetical protein CLV59_107287 [Chitinophaga dinghuensis]|uniref:Uncharacterized protein n=1 Tax=Chitinophaga dinghuensis TaxID=1539050 RepID=A0A327VTY8_9BACT|nr:hypothetical protein [Chitinophaga dinghuensis]RAJ77520.1 hypothetical protein CLV59_107287 [Chitinophaga dinghuensis]
MVQPLVKENLTVDQIQAFQQVRQTFLLAKFQPEVAKAASITYWEQLTCIGFNPDLSRLEAIVRVKQATGYSGNLCSLGSLEYVRFFVDYHDGNGFKDAGLTSFKVADIPDAPSTNHPLNYMATVYLNDEAHRKITACDTAVMPTVRGVLAWNTIPSSNPNDVPYFGNVLDADIQLKRKPAFYLHDILTTVNLGNIGLPNIDPKTKVPVVPDPLPPVAEFYKTYQAAGVPDQRTFYTSIVPQLAGVAQTAPTAQAYDVASISKLGVNLASLGSIISKPVIVDNSKADVTFEELTCVGLNTATDTVGGVLKIKKSAGFNGNMCTAGSNEYVAFWADWNNDGIFESYLGTASVNTHDITGIPANGLYYNVALQVDIAKHLRGCESPNVVKIRGVLSWQTLPSTTDPNALNFYGNRVDSFVQIRPGVPGGGQLGLNLFDVNGVAISNIDQTTSATQGLAYPGGLYPNAAMPFGGLIKLSGLFTNSGASGTTFYKVQFSDNNGSTWQDILDKQIFQIIEGSVQSLVTQDPTTNAGWYTYLPSVPTKAEKLSLLALWDSGNRNGLHKLRILYTKDPAHAAANISTSAPVTVMLDNTGFIYDNTPGTTLDPTQTLDIVIVGGDCKFYKSGDVINGQLTVTDNYFNNWYLDIQPSGHIIPAGTPVSTFITPASHTCTGFADHGDTALNFTINTKYLQSCGYTITLRGYDRSLVGYKINFIDGSYLYNLTDHGAAKSIGFAVLP